MIQMHAMSRMTYVLLAISSGVLFGVLVLCGNIFEDALLTPGRHFLIESEPSSAVFSWEALPPSKRLEWVECYPGRQCARLIVPLNYSDPDGPEATIALIRRPSKFKEGSKHYRGPVVINPGGPGRSGVDAVLIVGDLLATIIGPQFDVVGFDPRGVLRSTPRVSFFQTKVEQELWGWEKAIMVNNSDEGIARTWARATVVGKLASESDSGYLRHINTDNTARDMLSIVKAHGRSKLQYWGFSYGTVLGATFAAMFPGNVERLVIDGVVDSENYYATLWSNNLLDTEKTLDTFFIGCAEAGPDGCAFWAPTPEDIKRNLTFLYDSIRTRPMPIRTKINYGVLDYGTVRGAVFTALYSPYTAYPSLAQALASLAVGDGNMLFDSVYSPPSKCSCEPSIETLVNVREAQMSILCNDGDDVPDDLESTQKYFEELSDASGWADIWAKVRLDCVGWPKFPKDHFQGPFIANTSHPILLIGNTADPVTPLWAAKKMSKGFKNSAVLAQNSPGHCSIAAPSLCTQTYIRNYFLHGTLPEPGTVCEPIGKPFPDFKPMESSSEKRYHSQEALTADMTTQEKELYEAVYELSRNPIITPPF